MKVLFLSNYFNHHQKPFSDAMYVLLGENYLFIEMEEMSHERKKLGYGIKQLPSYVVGCNEYLNDNKMWQVQIDNADIVMSGGAPHKLLKRRIQQNKLIFYCSERPLKNGLEFHRYPDRFLRWHRWYPQNKNVHLLCASAYAAGDYAKFLLFRGKSYKWGYFPETRWYEDVSGLIQFKKPASLIWVARFIDWKHPEIAVEIAKRLKRDGYTFSLEMIGNGKLLDDIRELIHKEGVADVVSLPGAMTPEEVRDHMEAAQIHIFTSDCQEGWGAVLNEAMNSACVSIADRNIGAAPYLIEDGKNGFLYSGVDDLYEKVKFLLEHQQEREMMAKEAYRTIVQEWNAETAAERFLGLAEQLVNKKDAPHIMESGVCSKAERL